MALILEFVSATYGTFRVPVVDMSDIRAYYNENNVDLGILSLCNGQEYRMIDGYGKGNFIIANKTIVTTIESVEYVPECDPEHPDYDPDYEDCPESNERFTRVHVRDALFDVQNVDLIIYNNEPFQSKIVPERKRVRFVKVHGTSIVGTDFDNEDMPLLMIETEEDKARFAIKKARRNYNILKACEVDTESGTPDLTYEDPDGTPKNLQVILNDLVSFVSGYTLLSTYFDADLTAIIPTNLTIDHLTTLEALDHICKAYNLGWTSYFDSQKVVVLPFTDLTANFLNEREAIEHQSDNIAIDDPVGSKNTPYELLIYFRIWYKAGPSFRKKKPVYYVISNRTGTDDRPSGRILKHYFPFNYAYFNPEDAATDDQSVDPINLMDLEVIYDDILDRCEKGNVVKRYEYQKFISTYVDRPTFIDSRGFHHHSIIYADYGPNHNTILKSDLYPFLPVPASDEIYCMSGGSVIGFGEYLTQHTLIPPESCPITVPPPVSGNILVTEPPCDDLNLLDEEIPMYDPLGCVLDHPEEDLDGVRVVFTKSTIKNPFFNNAETIPDPEDPEGPEIPNPCYDPRVLICEYVLIDRCCVAADTAPILTPIPPPGVETTTTNYTLNAATDTGVLVDATSGALTIGLPAAALNTDVEFFIKKTDASVNTVTVDANGAETIDGSTTQVISTQYVTLTVYCNGTSWFII